MGEKNDFKFNNPISEKIARDRYYKDGENSPQDVFRRVAKHVSNNTDEEKMFFDMMNSGYAFPAGRVMSNAGIGTALTMNNCYNGGHVNDDICEIFESVKIGALTHKAGGGIGHEFSKIRPAGAPTSNDAIASGVVSFMKVFNAQTACILQGGRRGANMGVLSVYHPDIIDFIEAKTKSHDLDHFNLSVMVDDDFMRAVNNKETITLHFPVYDEKSNIIGKDRNELWKITKPISAVELWNKIMTSAYNFGEPGVLFYDTMNRMNNTNYVEKIVSTNPCGEFISGTILKDDKKYAGACNLGSIFLHNHVNNPFTDDAEINYQSLEKSVKSLVLMLDNIIDINNYPVEMYENYQKAMRTIGVGVTGLASALAMLRLPYNSMEARIKTDELMNDIALYTYRASVDLAKTKGSFPLYDNRFLESEFLNSHSSKPTFKYNTEEWECLKRDIETYGIRNARLLSVAPVGTGSLVWGNNCSSGIEPIFSLEYNRKIKIGGQDDKDAQTVTLKDYAWSLANYENVECFPIALEIDPYDHLRMLEEISKHVDMSVSKTINIPENYSFEEMKNVYTFCWMHGIKGCTVFRPNAMRQGIFTDKKQEEVKSQTTCETCGLGRGDIVEVSDDLLSAKRTITSGCGKFYLHSDFDEFDGTQYETFIDVGSGGGCERNLQFESRLMSYILRLGGTVEGIVDQAKSVKPCTAYMKRTLTYGDTSPGTSCPSAIGFALEDLNNKIHDRCFADEDEEQEEESASIATHTVTDTYGKQIAEVVECLKCPECGSTLQQQGGCVICLGDDSHAGCGWSRCD